LEAPRAAISTLRFAEALTLLEPLLSNQKAERHVVQQLRADAARGLGDRHLELAARLDRLRIELARAGAVLDAYRQINLSEMDRDVPAALRFRVLDFAKTHFDQATIVEVLSRMSTGDSDSPFEAMVHLWAVRTYLEIGNADASRLHLSRLVSLLPHIPEKSAQVQLLERAVAGMGSR